MTVEPKAFATRSKDSPFLSRDKHDEEAQRSLRSLKIALSPWANAGLLLSVLLIAGLGYLTLQSTRHAEENSHWIVRAQTVQKALQSVLADTVDTASGGRVFALTGQGTFLDVEDRAEQRLSRDLDLLHSLSTDNPSLQKSFTILHEQVNASLENTLKIEADRQRAGKGSTDAELLESKRNLDAVKSTVSATLEEEAKLLVLREEQARTARAYIRIIVLSGVALGVGLVTLSGIFLRRELRYGVRMQAELLRLNAESKRAEEEARRSESRLVGATESSMDCLYFCDAVRDATGAIEDFVFTHVNTNAVDLVTFSREELIGQRMGELFPINKKLGLIEKYRHVVLTGESFVSEFSIREESVKTSWLRIQAARLGDGVAITASDITARKEVEESLRKSQALLERTERLTDTGGWEIDLVTGEVFWSREVYRILGVPLDYKPTLDKGIDFYLPEDRPKVRAAVDKAIASGEIFDMECTIVRLDGRRVPVRVVGEAEHENGKPVRVTGAFKDITQRVKERSALKAVNDRLSLATDSGGIGIWEWDIAHDELCWDPWMYRLYGMEPCSGQEIYELWKQHLHPEDVEATERLLRDAVAGIRPYDTDFRIIWNDGSVHSIRATGVVSQDDAGHAIKMIGTNSDVTAQRESELEQAKLTEFMHSILSSSPFATIVTDLSGIITSINPAAERMLWHKREELINQATPLVFLSPAEVTKHAVALSEELQSTVEPGIGVLTANPQRGRLEEAEWEMIRRDGTHIDAQLTVSALTDARNTITGYLLVAYDITERKRAQDYISHLAHHDALTGLPTRTLFRDRLNVALEHGIRNHRRVGVLLVDLDNFKRVNDLMGHHVGDELLVVIAKRLTSCVRASDTVARMGGDEFTIVLDELSNVEDAELVAEKIVREITMPVSIGSHIIHPAASIGISIYPEDGQTAEAIIRNADAAMYQAKANGRNGRQTYTPEMAVTASRKRALEDGLARALALNEFALVFQPQVCMRTGTVTRVEALLRWRSPQLGLVMPNEFIFLAEENGLIVPIGEWVLRCACLQARQLQREMDRPLTVSVNVSPRQFQQNDLPQMIRKILRDADLNPLLLELELTENILMGDLPRPKAILEEIRSLGVHVAIDDFGTGYSSMSYVLRFRVDRIKIDQSFVCRMHDDPDSRTVTSAVIALAKGLHIAVVAEGVETAVQRDLLLREGCDEAQGYFYSRPIPVEDLPAAIYAIEHPEYVKEVA